jgi:hypothetical protein
MTLFRMGWRPLALLAAVVEQAPKGGADRPFVPGADVLVGRQLLVILLNGLIVGLEIDLGHGATGTGWECGASGACGTGAHTAGDTIGACLARGYSLWVQSAKACLPQEATGPDLSVQRFSQRHRRQFSVMSLRWLPRGLQAHDWGQN